MFYCSSGKYFKWAAHDDLLGPKFLSECLEGFKRLENNAVLVYPNFVFVDEAGVPLNIDSAFVHTTSASPASRVRETLAGLQLVTSVFGLFRRDALARTRLIGSYQSADFALLLECAMLGQIVRLEGRPQFQRRLHDKSSQVNKTDEEIAVWFDPDVLMNSRPDRRLRREYFRSVFMLDGLSNTQRLSVATALFFTIAKSKLRSKAKRVKRRMVSRLEITSPIQAPPPNAARQMMPSRFHKVDTDKE